jgi:hypothetical protein
MTGGANNPEVANMSEEELRNLALEKVERHLGIADTPAVAVAEVMYMSICARMAYSVF